MGEFDKFVPEEDDSFRVKYNAVAPPLIADLVPEHLDNVIRKIREESRSARRYILKNVERALATYSAAIRAGSPLTSQDHQDAADDIGIWWAYEFFAGRGSEHIVEKTPLHIVWKSGTLH